MCWCICIKHEQRGVAVILVGEGRSVVVSGGGRGAGTLKNSIQQESACVLCVSVGGCVYVISSRPMLPLLVLPPCCAFTVCALLTLGCGVFLILLTTVVGLCVAGGCLHCGMKDKHRGLVDTTTQCSLERAYATVLSRCMCYSVVTKYPIDMHASSTNQLMQTLSAGHTRANTHATCTQSQWPPLLSPGPAQSPVQHP